MPDAPIITFKSQSATGMIVWGVLNTIWGAGCAWVLGIGQWLVIYHIYNVLFSGSLFYAAFSIWRKRHIIEVYSDGRWTVRQRCSDSTQTYSGSDVTRLVIEDVIADPIDVEAFDTFEPKIRVGALWFSLHSPRTSSKTAERDLQRFATALGIEREVTHIPRPPVARKPSPITSPAA